MDSKESEGFSSSSSASQSPSPSSGRYKTGTDTVGTVSVNPETDEVDFNFEEMSAKELSKMKQVKIKVETYEGKHEKS